MVHLCLQHVRHVVVAQHLHLHTPRSRLQRMLRCSLTRAWHSLKMAAAQVRQPAKQSRMQVPVAGAKVSAQAASMWRLGDMTRLIFRSQVLNGCARSGRVLGNTSWPRA